MLKGKISLLTRLSAAIAVCCFATAQIPLSAQTANDNDIWLAQTAKLYYSSARAGLKGFDCTLRTNWQDLYTTTNGSMSDNDAKSLATLNRVGIVLHARMKGGSTMDWNPPAQLDGDQSSMLSQMHDAMNQIIVDGFMQFWTPFIENSVVPDSSNGLEMTATAGGGMKIHIKNSDFELDETFDAGRILRQYNIVMSNARIKLTPTYSPSAHGLIISNFHALIHPPDGQSGNSQEMNVEVQYETIDGFPLPTHFVMEVTGVAKLHLAMEGCTVQR